MPGNLPSGALNVERIRYESDKFVDANKSVELSWRNDTGRNVRIRRLVGDLRTRQAHGNLPAGSSYPRYGSQEPVANAVPTQGMFDVDLRINGENLFKNSIPFNLVFGTADMPHYIQEVLDVPAGAQLFVKITNRNAATYAADADCVFFTEVID